MEEYLNLIIYRGVTFFTSLEYDLSEDLSAWTGVMQWKEHPQDDTTIFTASTANSRLNLTSTGKVEISISAEDTAAITADEVVFDILLQDDEDTIYMAFEGRFVIRDTISSI